MIGVSSDIPGDAQQFHPNIGSSEPAEPSFARARRLRLHTHHELVAIMRTDSPVCHAEGLAAHTQVYIRNGSQPIAATLYQVEGDFLAGDGLFDGNPILACTPALQTFLQAQLTTLDGTA